jgi:hypothetical protein
VGARRALLLGAQVRRWQQQGLCIAPSTSQKHAVQHQQPVCFCIGSCTTKHRLHGHLPAQGLGLGEEDVGLIGVSWEGRFIELVPWNAELEWDVDPWGRW